MTHRLVRLTAVDEIVVLDAGRMVQRGTHAHLVSVDGPYRRMWTRERSTDGRHARVTSA
jgi:ATP-binding cassette, subfamily C, bacterial CydCD